MTLHYPKPGTRWKVLGSDLVFTVIGSGHGAVTLKHEECGWRMRIEIFLWHKGPFQPVLVEDARRKYHQ